MKIKELKPVRESTEDYDAIERRIRDAFRQFLYLPLMRELGAKPNTLKLENAKRSSLLDAIATGQIAFDRGTFTGKFNAQTTKEIKSLGGVWDKKTASFKISKAGLPKDVRDAIATSEARFQQKLADIDKQLSRNLPAEIAGKIRTANLLDSTLWRVDRELSKTLKGIHLPSALTPEQSRRIADEWQENLDLWIKGFAEEEILKLRSEIKESAFKGNRQESIIKLIQKSYGVTLNKAKFLAQQETSLLLSKFKETRYVDAGLNEYKWRCVKGSPAHPVRPAHKALDGSIQSWNNPPITSPSGEPARRNHPGQDYRCRCTAIPIVKFRSG